MIVSLAIKEGIVPMKRCQISGLCAQWAISVLWELLYRRNVDLELTLITKVQDLRMIALNVQLDLIAQLAALHPLLANQDTNAQVILL